MTASTSFIPRRRQRMSGGSSCVHINKVSPSPLFESVSQQNDIYCLQLRSSCLLSCPVMASPSPPHISEYLIGISRHYVVILAQINSISIDTFGSCCFIMTRPKCQCHCRCIHRPARGNMWKCRVCMKYCCQSCIGWKGKLCHVCVPNSDDTDVQPPPLPADVPEVNSLTEDS